MPRDESSSKNASAKPRGTYNTACDVCSRRKHKCDGIRPVCQPCHRVGRSRECSWVNHDGRRHRGEQQPMADANTKQTEALRKLLIAYSHYADGLESIMDRLLHGHQHPVVLDFRASRPKDPEDLMGLAVQLENTQLDDTWDQDGDFEDSDKDEHSPSIRDLCLGNNRYPLTIAEGGLHYYGNTAPFRFKTHEPSQPSRFPSIAQNPEGRYVLLVDQSTEEHYNPDFHWSRYLPKAVPLDRKSHDSALDLLFKYFTTFCLRIIPDLFLRDMCLVLSVPEGQEPPKATHYSPMLHNILVALALGFSDDPRFRDLQARKYFIDAGKSYMEVECQQPNISVVQALSLLGSFYGTQGDQGLGFIYFGLSARVAQALGLTVDCSEWVQSGAIEESERIDRNWAGWTTFTSDVCWSLFVGRDFSVPLPDLIEFPMPFVDPELDNMPIAYGNLPPQPNYITKTFEANCMLFIIARSILDIIPRLNRRRIRLAVIDELISNVDMKLHTWCRDLAPELQITNKSRSSSSPHKLLLHLSYHWLFVLLHRPLFHLKSRSGRAGQEIDHVKHCKTASRNIMELLALWDTLYGLRFCPITIIQIAFSAGTVFLLSAIQACSGIRIAQKELRGSLDQQAIVLNYLQLVGRSWPGAIKIATILKDLMHDRLTPLLARRKIPIQNGEILQIQLGDKDDDEPTFIVESVSSPRRAGIQVPGKEKRVAGSTKKPRPSVTPSMASGSSTSPTQDPVSPMMGHSLSQGSISSPTLSKRSSAITIPRHAVARSPSSHISSFEVISSVNSDAESVISPGSSPEARSHAGSTSPLEIPAYPLNYAFLGFHHVSDFPDAGVLSDNHAGSSNPHPGGIHDATSSSSWAPTFSNSEFSGVLGMPGGRSIPQTPYWSPLGCQVVPLDDVVSSDDYTPFAPPITSENFGLSEEVQRSMYLATVNSGDTDQSMSELDQWIRHVSQSFS